MLMHEKTCDPYIVVKGGKRIKIFQCVFRASPEKHSRMFSSCSIADWDVSLNMGIAACLTENPEPTFPQQCGNRHVERGEECDCGSPEVSCHVC